MAKTEFKTFDQWDSQLIQDFINVHNQAVKLVKNSLVESKGDFKDVIGEKGAFAASHIYLGVIFYSKNQPVARVMFSCKKNDLSGVAQFGYFDCVEDQPDRSCFENALLLFREKLTKNGITLKSIEGPIQFSFFNSYRLKKSSSIESFYGEPQNPENYYSYLENLGFQHSRSWNSVSINKEQANAIFRPVWKKVEPHWNKQGVNIRSVNLKKWDLELKNIYNLLQESYVEMPQFSDIDWKEFKSIYSPLQFIVDPDFFLFAEVDGKTIGFLIGLIDPLPVLAQMKSNIKKHPLLSPWYKILALKKLKSKQGRLIIPYIGKLPNEKRARWVTSALGYRCSLNAEKRGVKEAIIAFIDSESPVKIALSTKLPTISEYCIFQKELS